MAQLMVQGLDHIPIAVRDLEQAGADFEALGFVLKPGTHFALLAKNKLHERVLASPALASGALFLRGEKHLYRIRAQ